jgi:hypothetical protein
MKESQVVLASFSNESSDQDLLIKLKNQFEINQIEYFINPAKSETNQLDISVSQKDREKAISIFEESTNVNSESPNDEKNIILKKAQKKADKTAQFADGKIRGWLILPALGLIATPIINTYDIITNSKSPMLVIANISFIVFTIFLTFVFFGRKSMYLC